jgi:methylated-DNA-[protein]-cysteine S-methyltransferase
MNENMLELQLRGLDRQPPEELERSTLVTVGAADLMAITDTPLGVLWVAWSTRGVTGVTPVAFADSEEAFARHHRRRVYRADHLPSDLASVISTGLQSGDTTDIPVDLSGVTSFQRSVLSTCATIPVGSVRPYGWIASEIGSPGAVRAVGTALGRNPVPLIIPCHRVVRSDGAVGNYAFGPDMKHDLLIREGAILA